MSEQRLSQSRLAKYVACPRQYRFEYELGVDTSSQAERYFNFGNALHRTIEDVCDTVRESDAMTDEEIRAYAANVFPDHWAEETTVDAYPTRAVFEQDNARAKEAIRTFFADGPGIRHARTSVATELDIEFERDGIPFRGYIDNVLETDEGLHLVDYKSSDIDLPFGYDNYVEKHHEGAYYPGRLKPALQASLYMAGIEDTDYFEDGMAVDFTFYALLYDDEVDRRPDGLDVTVSGKARNVGSACRDNADIIWELIREAATGIHDGNYEVDRWDDVKDETCPDCSYRKFCSRYLNEVRQY